MCARRYFFLQTDFLTWEILLIKKLEIEETKPTFLISVLKVEYQVRLVFSKSNFFITKISQGRKYVHEKSTFSRTFAFNQFLVFSNQTLQPKLPLTMRSRGRLRRFARLSRTTIVSASLRNIESLKKPSLVLSHRHCGLRRSDGLAAVHPVQQYWACLHVLSILLKIMVL